MYFFSFKDSNTAPNSAVHSPGIPLKLRIRINPGDYNLTVPCDTNFTILQLKESIEKIALSSIDEITRDPEMITVAKQRMIYMGKEMFNNHVSAFIPPLPIV